MKVLIALDGHETSRRAAREAVRLLPDAEFLVLNVAQLRAGWMAAGEFGVPYPMSGLQLLKEGLDKPELALEAEAAGLDEPDLLTIEGDPAAVICEVAERHDVDLVVVGSHDKGVVRRLLDPSVAQAVVQGTFRPVLVVSGERPDEVDPGGAVVDDPRAV